MRALSPHPFSAASRETDTKSFLIHKRGRSMTHEERLDCQSRVAWAAWTHRYGLLSSLSHHANEVLILLFLSLSAVPLYRIFSVNSSVAAAFSVAVAAEVVQTPNERAKTWSTAYTSPSKTSTKARPPNSRSPATSSARSAMARVERRVRSGHVMSATVAVSRLRSARWAR